MSTALFEKFYKAYCEYKGYDSAPSVIAGVDRALSIQYPVLVQKGGGRLIITVVRDLKMALDELCELPESYDLDAVMGFLFDEGISYEKDVSYISALDKESFKAADIPVGMEIRLLSSSDRRALSKLNKSGTDQDRLLAQVSMKDEMLAGVFENGELICAASVLNWGKGKDIGVITHPDHRGKGYAKVCINYLLGELFEKDAEAIAQYRCDKSNEASVKLMRSLDFIPMMELCGAIMDFSGE